MNLNNTSTDFTPSLISPSIPSSLFIQGEPLKLGIMASGSGTNFEAIARAIADKQLNAQIQVVIYNNPEAKVAAKAEHWQVPAVLINHRNFKSRKDCDTQIVETLRHHQVEWVVMVGWMRVVTPTLLDAFAKRVINIHPSLLPSFKGLGGVEQALAAGVQITGCTVHIAVPEVDSGPILIQAAVPVLPDDTPETLHDRIQVQEHKIIVAGIALAAAQSADW
ncbi:phosphoribosylglycinamide formyltransferase [Floridanema evergladense]|uniref:Phosphoribosylglycinamide formyltransferase n=1 Tax=Floridaenema evergladense BLCC-F167 TaxID=3153639 RepID=A0ABV4WFG3_9CYAN